MSELTKIQKTAVAEWNANNQWAAVRGIDEPMWNALTNTIYPGAKPESILLAVDYCRARQLDIMLKPVHLVPMQVTDSRTRQKEWRDVPMPGIGMYRVQASRSGDDAGHDEPEFGPIITREFTGIGWNKAPEAVTVSFPEWCKYTVRKLVGDRIVSYTAKEFWLENYATQSARSEAPNAMWRKRPFAQLAKCAEAQALRRGWPEVCQQPTAEEMEGKHFEIDVTPSEATQIKPDQKQEVLPELPEHEFEEGFPKLKGGIESGRRTATEIISIMGKKYTLSESQIERIQSVKQTIDGELA